MRRISIDEISMRKGHKDFKTVVCDIDKGELLEVIDSHKQQDIIEALIEQPIQVREAVTEVSVDMWGGFTKVVELVFPNAHLVIDRFHVMQPINQELNAIRKQVGVTHRGSKFLLLKNLENLTDSEFEQLKDILQQSRKLLIAYKYKEEFREIYQTSESVTEGKERMIDWLESASELYGKVIQTINNHLTGICNYFISQTTSGTMEGINNKIKLIKRQGYGFTNFRNFRLRLLASLSH